MKHIAYINFTVLDTLFTLSFRTKVTIRGWFYLHNFDNI